MAVTTVPYKAATGGRAHAATIGVAEFAHRKDATTGRGFLSSTLHPILRHRSLSVKLGFRA